MDTSYKNYIEEVDLQRYWLVLKRRWVPAALVFVACVSGAVFAALSEDDSYRASGKMLFQVDRSTSLTGVGQEFGDLETVGRVDPLRNEAEIARSLPVLEDVIEELELRDSTGDLLSPQDIRWGLNVRPDGGTDILRVTHQSPDPEFSTAVVNQLMASYIIRNIKLNRAEATAAREFVEGQLPGAKSALDQAAEELRQFYTENGVSNIDGRASVLSGLTLELESQANGLQVQLADANTRIAEIQQLLGLSTTQAQVAEALTASSAVQSALSMLEEIEAQLATQLSRYTETHPTVKNLRRQEISLRGLLAERVSGVIAQDLDINEVNSLSRDSLQLSGLNGDLTSQLVNAEVERLSIVSRLSTLEEQRQVYLEQSARIPTLELQERELQQNLGIANQSYENLVQRLADSRLAESQVLATVEIIESAEPPQFPEPKGGAKLIVVGIAAGLFLGVTLAFSLDLIDKSIKTVKDAEAFLGYPLMGLIPYFPTPDSPEISLSPSNGNVDKYSPRVIAISGAKPMAAAAYQMLQANLKFVSSDHRRRAITVTSSVAQEGKSEVCANLAAVIAQSGKHVLIVDADMRAPSQHHLWNVVNRIGLSHVLVGEGELSDAKQVLSQNLTLITAGVTPPNPLALVDSERMGSLVQTLMHQYDYVIFDTPPLAGTADAALVGKSSDGVLLVLRPRKADYNSVASAKSLLERAGAEVLGIVANGVNVNNEHDDYVVQMKVGSYPGNSSEKAEHGEEILTLPKAAFLGGKQ